MQDNFDVVNHHELIETNLDLADRLAKSKKRRTRQQISLQELRSAAYMGLVDAAQRYEIAQGPFRNFAARRIIGEMIDYVRETGWSNKSHSVRVTSLEPYITETRGDGGTASGLAAPPDCSGGNGAFIRRVAQHLPEQGRRMISWYYLDNLTMKEIAAKMDITEAMVSILMKEYRRRLGQLWAGRQHELWAEVRHAAGHGLEAKDW